MTSVGLLSFTNDRLDEVIQKAKDFAFTQGLVEPIKGDVINESVVTHISFMLAPSPIPQHHFEKLKEAQLDFNKLMYLVSQDYDFICSVLKSSVKYDEFTRNLLKIYHKVHQKETKDRGTLDIIRCDYMLDSNEQKFKQIEINTIAAGMAAGAALMPLLHRYTLRLAGKYKEANQVPDSTSLEGIATSLVRAWEVYGQPNASVLLVTEPADLARINHRHIEFSIHEINPRIPFMKMSLGDIGMRANLTDDQQLRIDGCEIAVVYYRTGYKPEFYKTKVEWKGRLLAEQSCAIKCPSIGGHLAGTKTVQQAISEPGVIEKYIDDPEAVVRIRNTFCRLYSLNPGPKGDHAADLGIENPEMFVLKPNRESGGNNLFGKYIKEKLIELKDSPERATLILMEKVEPVKINGYSVKPLEPVTLREMTYELGIYGTTICNSNGIIHSRQIGHLFRTKPADENEASLMAGIAVNDSPLLVS
ncbi:glutathione synthetase-like isoform X1 [Anneissia japonica]|uniref:glutathione synthetase-like isoform X1 n=1 Tax=Anneissia japonica TaxID=1529436 RepID=UPI0014254EF5|nr:glutathione synthetase-like isoform X1 [Anneissia japonica]